MKLRNRTTGREFEMPEGEPEIFVSVQDGRLCEREGYQKLLTSEEIVERAENKQVKSEDFRARLWGLVVPALLVLGGAAWVFHVIWESLHP